MLLLFSFYSLSLSLSLSLSCPSIFFLTCEISNWYFNFILYICVYIVCKMFHVNELANMLHMLHTHIYNMQYKKQKKLEQNFSNNPSPFSSFTKRKLKEKQNVLNHNNETTTFILCRKGQCVCMSICVYMCVCAWVSVSMDTLKKNICCKWNKIAITCVIDQFSVTFYNTVFHLTYCFLPC